MGGRVIAALVLLLLLLPVAAPAQWLDPDRQVFARDKAEHFAFGGVGVNLLVRGPWIARSWRDRPAKRLAWCLTLAVAWEIVQIEQAYRDQMLGRPGNGFGLLDVGAAMAGCGVAELVL